MHALMSLVGAFNWTLVAPLFSTDIYGLSGKHALGQLDHPKELKFPCTTMITVGMVSKFNSREGDPIRNLIKCLKSISNLRVVLLYMSPFLAMPLLRIFYMVGLHDLCFVFSAASSELLYQPSRISIEFFPFEYILGIFIFYIFVLGSISISPYIAFHDRFRSYVGRSTPKNHSLHYLRLWEDTFKCFYFDQQNPLPNAAKDLPLCHPDITYRSLPLNCRCTGTENLYNATISVIRFSFIFSRMLYM